ncbi:MAG: ATP-binding protein [Cyclobacteriaceae bacterium]|jgi:NadR type nicotinamide-nucleotide adenylyltransferase|nr:ATP-binding protein [Cyclobacteriaceae bacterium]
MENKPILICLYGSESTGKTTMAIKLAKLYNTDWVPEVARELLTTNHFNREDIITIGRLQTERIFEKIKSSSRILFCDSDLITTQIYSRHYLKVVPPILYQFESMVSYDHYFLFEPDVPWVADGLRDLNNERDSMHQIFREELIKRNIAFTSVKGNWMEREEIITKTLREKFSVNPMLP